MTVTLPEQLTANSVYRGPLDNDPLTDDELAILLAIPRWAEKAPNATIFRLPLGPEPTHGWVDITFRKARTIIARLATDWKTRLSSGTDALNVNVGPGTTICLLVEPISHALFHWLAFWALGCSIQIISLSMDDDTIALYLNKSECRVAIYSDISSDRMNRIGSGCNAAMIQLPTEEYAHRLAFGYRCDQDDLAPWPEPQRPDPAVILHSSGSTGVAKLLQFSLHFYTLALPKTSGLDAQGPTDTTCTTNLRPYFVFSPPYWQSFTMVLVTRLVSGSAIAFAHVADISRFPSHHFIDWARGLGAGEIMCAPRFIRDILASGPGDDVDFLRGLNKIIVGGSALDESTSNLAEKYELKLINTLGCTELGAILFALQPPFTHLRFPPGHTPLILPISDNEPDGSRHVQFWYSCSTSNRIAHLYAKGNIPLKLEPFPGNGPHKGEPAMKLEDIFKEVKCSSGTGSQVSYIHLGRSDDLIKLAGNGGWDVNASAYETELTLAITSYLTQRSTEKDQWAVDGVQLFGNNRPCTALVIQLDPINQELGSKVGEKLYSSLSDLTESVNRKLNLGPHRRVNVGKRMLVVNSGGGSYGPGVQGLGGEVPLLLKTHKHTMQRWRNVQAFNNWLDEIDYGDP